MKTIDQGLSENLLLAARVSPLQIVTGRRKNDLLMTEQGPRLFSGLLWTALNTALSYRVLLEYVQTDSMLYLRMADPEFQVTVDGHRLVLGEGYTIDSARLCQQLAHIQVNPTASRATPADAHPDTMTGQPPHRACLLIDADFLFEDPEHPRDAEHVMTMRLAAHSSQPMPGNGLNLVLLAGQPGRLPTALRDLASVRNISISSTSLDERRAFCRLRLRALAERCELPLDNVVALLTKLSDNMQLNDLNKIIQTADQQGIRSLNSLTEVVRAYQNGIANSPWASDHLHTLIAGAEDSMAKRVKGQPLALGRITQSLKRAAVGLDSGTRGPRSVLLFSGPTGTGKTESAKAMAELIYGDETALARFDCAEMKEAHSVARLIGAPPGYVGHDAGGTLVTRLRERPQSIILMDEIEKAHPTIWDLFLGILEDGRITGGNGQFASFSDAIIIITCNIGLLETVPDENAPAGIKRQQRFNLTTPYADIAEGVCEAMKAYFTNELGRAEIWGRIGDKNLVVFDFIRDLAGITRKLIELRVQSARRLYDLDIRVPEEVIEHVTALAAAKPESLIYGARGLREQIDHAFNDPLDSFIFDQCCRQGRINTTIDANGRLRFQLLSN